MNLVSFLTSKFELTPPIMAWSKNSSNISIPMTVNLQQQDNVFEVPDKYAHWNFIYRTGNLIKAITHLDLL